MKTKTNASLQNTHLKSMKNIPHICYFCVDGSIYRHYAREGWGNR